MEIQDRYTNDDQLILGVDIGGTNIKLGLMTNSGKLAYLQESPLNASGIDNKDVTSSTIISHISTFLAEYKHLRPIIKAIGIGCPGIIDHKSGYIREISNIPGLAGINLRDQIAQHFELPTQLDNDANMAALGEYTWGSGKGHGNMIMITIGTDIGASLILDGKLYRGDQFAAGEFGHVSVVHDGTPCSCGSKGCLGRYVSRDGIVNSYRKLIKNSEPSSNYLSPKIIAKRADEGDTLARQAFEQAGHYLGFALAGVINVLNPSCIVFGGGVSRAGKILLDPMLASIQEYALAIPAKHVIIRQAELGNEAGVLGAATSALTSL